MNVYILSPFFLILGLVIGSFLNVLIDRIPRGESVVKGRSHCDSCHHSLQWYDLFPLFSYISLKGKCRYCHKKIGWQAITLELGTGLLFVYVFIIVASVPTSYISLSASLLYILFFISCFIVITIIDIKYGIIPNAIVYPAVLVAFCYHLFLFSTVVPYLLSGLVAGLFFFLLFAMTKGRGMGFGDVKLAFLLGLFLGYPNIVIALYIAFLTGALVAFILVLLRRKKFSGGTIPFGPFLIMGAFFAFLYGDFFRSHVLSLFFRL